MRFATARTCARVAHVRRLDERGAAGGADHAGGLLQRLGSPPAQDQPRAGLGESDRPGLADAGARSGNPGDLVGNRTEHVSSGVLGAATSRLLAGL